ncbi:hypothetical protein WA1_49255 [Scytonema hofmannii PCC 7110]|uniref:DUF559 domain-containing protein n=1 Tax=Scytonema hofmannii PCC 7110 TaxID=128403 RepID=A0A139WQM1_9CYAN|nr:hypothetical protein [Scytonema hofmannii]KYC34729.1 hypothetical protein WA1_49255 [Scytonema hofmannii PCC 7110]
MAKKTSSSTPVYPIVVLPKLTEGNLSPSVHPSGSGTAPVGASEERFGNILKHHFGDWVKPQQEMLPPNHERPYTADFLIVEPTTGLHFDIEVDEPNSFSTGEPTHCIGDDDYRNKCFVDAGWVVIRFAEEQVSSQPERCCRFIANAIARLTLNYSLQSKLAHVEPVTKVKQWSKRYAGALIKTNYRNNYLPKN